MKGGFAAAAVAAAAVAAGALAVGLAVAPADARSGGRSGAQEAGIVVHKVQRGDTLELLAAEYYGDRRHKIFIMIENRLDHARDLKPGERLRIPVSNDVTVAVGDTLATLAAQSLGDERRAKYLAEFNGLDPGSTVAAGMTIAVPLRVTYRAAGREPLSDIAAGLFADAGKADLLKDYNGLKRDALDKGEKIIVPIYLRVHPSKRLPPDAESVARLAKRTKAMEEARRTLPIARAAWQAGDYEVVKSGLAELVALFPYLDTDLVIGIGVLLGSAHVAFDDLVLARARFEQVLERAPKHALSAYRHSPKVCEVWRKAGGAIDESATP